MVDTTDLKSVGESRTGSIPVPRTSRVLIYAFNYVQARDYVRKHQLLFDAWTYLSNAEMIMGAQRGSTVIRLSKYYLHPESHKIDEWIKIREIIVVEDLDS